MKKLFLAIAALMLLASPVQAQVASAEAFAYCAALAGAAADHQLNVAQDEDTAAAMQAVSDGYRAAAIIKASESMNAAEAHVEKIIADRTKHYTAGLTKPDDVPAVIFQSDTEACKLVEPQAYQVIDAYNKKHAGTVAN